MYNDSSTMNQRGGTLGLKRLQPTLTRRVVLLLILLFITNSTWIITQYGAADATDTIIQREEALVLDDDNNDVCEWLTTSSLFTYDYCHIDDTDTTNIQEQLQVQSTSNDSKSSQEQTNLTRSKRIPGMLRPLDLPPPEIFTNFVKNTTIQLPNEYHQSQTIYYGTIQQVNKLLQKQIQNTTNTTTTLKKDDVVIGTTDFLYIPNLMEINSVTKILNLLYNFHHYDIDPDTVDGMSTYEIFIDSPDIQKNNNYIKQYNNSSSNHHHNHDQQQQFMKSHDYDPTYLPERIQLRKQIQAILQPIIQQRITPLLLQQYPHLCQKKNDDNYYDDKTMNGNNIDDRSCTPCYSLIRRYRSNERMTHGTHYDGHALITVVVSFSNYSTNYLGGLYVSTGYGQKQFVPLYSGDAIIHQSTLLHGVQVLDIHTANSTSTTSTSTTTTGAERWSWILWYRDSVQCNDYSYEWFADCANRGDAICQELHATKIGNIPIINDKMMNDQVRQQYIMESIVQLNRISAEQGNGNAAIKMARAYLKLLPSSLVYNKTEAIWYYKLAIKSYHPDGYYGMANLYLESIQSSNDNHRRSQHLHRYNKTLSKVVRLLEEGAIRGHAYSMFNLGIVHCYGYGVSQIDTELAALWFVQCGLPEGYYAASYYAAMIGNVKQQEQYDQRARVLGYYEPWRKLARQRTGSGGASGVDINMPWPKAPDGRTPPIF